jgi:UDP-2,3-diacylglucosamine pyrophosphatase LpxH
MLVALSDLHFRDTTAGGMREGQNIPPATCLAFFRAMADWAREIRAREIVFVLTGDIFEFLRTEMWFQTESRPYDDFEFSSGACRTLHEIMNRIESANRRTLDIVKAVWRNDEQFLGFRFPLKPRFAYIPGNHDRFVHVVTELASRVGGWLGLKSPFPQKATFPEYGLFARHGHEYDWLNCEYNFERVRPGVDRDESLYRRSCLGDWLAIDIGTRIPYELRRRFPEEVDLYRAFVDIEDVRPVNSAFRWLRARCDYKGWRRLKEAMRAALVASFSSPFPARWINARRRYKLGAWPGILQAAARRVASSVDSFPDYLLGGLLRTIWSVEEDRVHASKILRDPEFASSGMKTLVHGHYHDSGVEFLDSGRAAVCIGGWRSRHTLCRDGRGYYRGKRLGYAVFYRKDERSAAPHGFDLTERFSAKGHAEVEGFGHAVPDVPHLESLALDRDRI